MSPDGRLPTLYVDIEPPEMAKLRAKRREALETWILQSSPSDFVDAQLHLDDDAAMPVRLRLKGDWGDHFTGEKWSYRVETRGDAALMGMTAFSLQDPGTRSYLSEWLFHENLRDEGVLAVRYGFVNVVQNGVRKGVYAVEEAFTKELVESQGRREGVIVRYDEDLLWSFWSAYDNDLSAPIGLRRFHIVDEFDSAAVAASPTLSAMRDAAVGSLRAWEQGQLRATDVFDVDATARYWALVDLWGAQHALQWHNLRYYYNPVTTLLEPIGFDAQPTGAGARVDSETLPGRAASVATGDERLQRAYLEHLWTFAQPAYVDRLEADHGERFRTLGAALDEEYGEQTTAAGLPVLEPPWQVLRDRQNALRELLSPLQMAYAYRVPDAPTDGLWLEVGNLTGFPVALNGLRIGRTELGAQAAWIVDEATPHVVPATEAGGALVLRPLVAEAAQMPYVRLRIPDVTEVTDETGPLELQTSLWGVGRAITQPVLAHYASPAAGPLPDAPVVSWLIERRPYMTLSTDSDQMLTIPPGTWAITNALVLPKGYGLALGPGTTLRFSQEGYLLARGPLSFQGTEDAPVVLEPLETVWKGIAVLGSDRPSVWSHVVVRDTDVVNVPGWQLTGALTFYENPISMQDVWITGTRAEDALNLIHSDFALERVLISDTDSDALDADFCRGQIAESTFFDIGGDGIDASGSQITVTKALLRNLGDKGVSVGEMSTVHLGDIAIQGSRFGIVSKDLSHTTVQRAVIADVTEAALAAYTKKASFGPATLTATSVETAGIASGRITLVQTGSWIDLDGERCWGGDVDVEALYRP